MSQTNTARDTKADKEYYGNVHDYGGDGPHIRLITSDGALIIVPKKVLSDGS